MEHLGDILAGRHIDEPAEVQIIKRFVREQFKTSTTVTIQPQQIIINVRGAALAGALRPRLPEIKRLCATEKRLVLRIN